ncbi:DUF1796 family putative cysteine peptidase [Paenibacillus aurantiacus]|uniref:DUF1796 family putative cysteine peptidase n=1 Tax=Paenibacillus aurantiacus TaxID=1936118 RepID=A0ABV5KZZ7_9BACL
MKLSALKGTYDAIYSLGDVCLAGIQMEHHGMRHVAGPLDWMASYNLPQVIRLLANRFAGFMDYNHLRVEGMAGEKIYLVKEMEYDILSNHDFFVHNNFPPHLAAYPEIKAKYDRRVSRFLEKAANSNKILYIRTEATFEQTIELQAVLAGLVANDFRLLIINHDPVPGIVELDWGIDKVCALQLPNDEKWNGNNHLWAQIFSHITLTEN